MFHDIFEAAVVTFKRIGFVVLHRFQDTVGDLFRLVVVATYRLHDVDARAFPAECPFDDKQSHGEERQ